MTMRTLTGFMVGGIIGGISLEAHIPFGFMLLCLVVSGTLIGLVGIDE